MSLECNLCGSGAIEMRAQAGVVLLVDAGQVRRLDLLPGWTTFEQVPDIYCLECDARPTVDHEDLRRALRDAGLAAHSDESGWNTLARSFAVDTVVDLTTLPLAEIKGVTFACALCGSEPIGVLVGVGILDAEVHDGVVVDATIGEIDRLPSPSWLCIAGEHQFEMVDGQTWAVYAEQDALTGISGTPLVSGGNRAPERA